MTIDSRRIHALVVGIEGYDLIFKHETEKLPAVVKQAYGVDLSFSYDFCYGGGEAWGVAKSSSHDIYFIDGATDTFVLHHTPLSKAIRDLYPSTFIVGMSAMGSYLKRDVDGELLYDEVAAAHSVSTSWIAHMLELAHLLPRHIPTERELEDQLDNEIDKWKRDPKTARFMKDGW